MPPIFRFPNFSRPTYYMQSPKNVKPTPKIKTTEKKEFHSPKKEKIEEPFFEIFGLSLYFDDILLVCLIFFLYQEGVKDEGLFLALILLLLT